MKNKEDKIKQKLLKSLLAIIGQNKVCDSLVGINKAFDILLEAQKEEIIEILKEDNKSLNFGATLNNGVCEYGCMNRVIEILKKLK